MTYFKPYVDSTGLHIPTYNDILEDMIAAMKQIYGDDIYLDNSSPDYQLLSIFALKQSDTLQAMAYAYNARSPETAIGTSLDSVVKLNGIKRKAAGHSTCQVKITGSPFTQITNGAVKDRAGLTWDLPANVVIDSNGTAYTVATCRTAGAVSALAGDISQIETPTYGWVSVRNEVAAVLGNAQETDAQLRERQTISTANPSQTMLDGTKGAIAALKNVSRYAVYENDTNVSSVTDDNPYGLPAHSVTCVVEGGTDEDVAEAIFLHKGIGCYTHGDVEVQYTDQNDYINRVRFFRPVYKDIFVKVVLKKYTGYISTMTVKVREAVYNYLAALTIGSDVSASVLSNIITDCNPSLTKPIFGIKELKLGLSKSAMAAQDIDIGFKEIPNPAYANIEVTLE
ncbi:baseplate J/gp47 family protein [Phascolarctobacterium succinatutens]|uniref:baseplate J/gp47 family protein n=1 Tax=Phascolarctobacterium succinatutens TaxID=626940 RepID=UPI002675F120|nr:baseplate J/gp47 family protein [Phascolarctobacterium succinatutens]